MDPHTKEHDMAMTPKQALAFRLLCGKTIGEASLEDWYDNAELREKVSERYEALDPATATVEDRQRMQASLDRFREEDEAMAIVMENLPEDAKQKLAKIRQARQ